VPPRTLQHVLTTCAGELLQGDPATPYTRVHTDTRHTQPGDLFIALTGEHHDGHDHLPEAAQKQAAALVVERAPAPATRPPCPILRVPNTRHAYGQLAARHRADHPIPIIAVAGANGKTTTKELIAAALRPKLATLASQASYNNHIGVPATLLRLNPTHQAAVLEVGTNHPGELAPLLDLIQPRYGVITHIGREHLEFFGDLAGVAQEEGTLAEKLPPDGTLFLNGDDEWTEPIARRTPAPVVRVGLGAGNDWRARDVRLDAHGMTFRVESPRAEWAGEYRIQLLGRHQVVNALFALAVGAALGLSRAELATGLRACEPAKMRLELWEWNGVRVLDDAYNANPDSMEAALRVLQELPCHGRRVAVLGDMGELGAHSASAHAEVGRRAAELGVSQLIAVGKMAGIMGQAAREAGLNRVIELAEVEAAVPALKSFLKAGDTVLLKASRASRLERITQALRASENGRKN